jgi:hypothetical protein
VRGPSFEAGGTALRQVVAMLRPRCKRLQQIDSTYRPAHRIAARRHSHGRASYQIVTMETLSDKVAAASPTGLRAGCRLRGPFVLRFASATPNRRSEAARIDAVRTQGFAEQALFSNGIAIAQARDWGRMQTRGPASSGSSVAVTPSPRIGNLPFPVTLWDRVRWESGRFFARHVCTWTSQGRARGSIRRTRRGRR